MLVLISVFSFFLPNACYFASSVSALFSCSVALDSSVGDKDRGMQADSDVNVCFSRRWKGMVHVTCLMKIKAFREVKQLVTKISALY